MGKKTMENRRAKNNNNRMMRCKKHPKHQQSPGVCSICLREKLSQLSSPTSTLSSSMASSSSSSSSSSFSSSSYVSSYSSPIHRRHRVGLESRGYSTTTSFLKSTTNFLTKSRSMVAFTPPVMDNNYGKKKKKGGFWFKLVHPTTKRMDQGLVHSMTMRERITPTRVHS